MRILLSCFLVISLAISLPACNRDSSSDATPAPVGTLPDGEGVEVAGIVDIFPYRAYIPANYDETKEYPVLVSLHGTGANGSTMINGWRAVADQEDFIVLAPEYFDNGTYFTVAGESAVFEMIEDLDDAYGVDYDRLYLNGFSTGGSWSYVFGITYSEEFAAASVFSGGYTGENLLFVALATRAIPFYLSHGTQDAVLSVEGARSAADALEFFLHPVEYDEHGGGHSTPPDVAEQAWEFMSQYSL